MARRKRFREEFIFAIIFISLVVFALVSDWWKDNQILGWTIVIAVFIMLLLAFIGIKRFRSTLTNTAKKATEKIVYEDQVSSREPIPGYKRKQVLKRARRKCENPDCKTKRPLHIHHIDMNNSNNDYKNLAVLCPSCHWKAHHGGIPKSQVYNWAQFNYGRIRNRKWA